jgi:hypothetical protein
VPFDTSVGKLDSWTYYSETRDGYAPTTLPSDFFLSQYGETRDSWNVYAASQEAWVKDYVDGYAFSHMPVHKYEDILTYACRWKKLIVLENDVTQLKDCTEIVFKAFPWDDGDDDDDYEDPCVASKSC